MAVRADIARALAARQARCAAEAQADRELRARRFDPAAIRAASRSNPALAALARMPAPASRRALDEIRTHADLGVGSAGRF